MSLRSGGHYQKKDTPMQQNEASGEQTTKKHGPPKPFDAKSKSSRASSRASRRSSSTTSSATKAYARAKAAQAHLAYAEKEADMMKQRADLEASMLK